ncbi:hypothetical protein [Desulfosporosinus nitroreducens]|uniref:hypothetical protein n=1 Tax=Desulfosporosinus nitroreducens TaxID=2018668 RepID=UPI00207CB997|nr:hypothetical protein [Desulfosporosinus nitroreducens]MCO1603436.1 hypothetical protein [Desulfosporosinus nitroreducens]
MTCPLCGAHDTGRIGRKRYYCHECCLEWTKNSGELKIYHIGPDGKACQLKGEQALEAAVRHSQRLRFVYL